MAGLDSGTAEEIENAASDRLKRHRRRAAAAPHVPLGQIVGEAPSLTSKGNFKNLEELVEQLAAPPLFELGKPLPNGKYLPKRRVGSCPAAHNRALLDDEAD